jgi:hypothetical protein
VGIRRLLVRWPSKTAQLPDSSGAWKGVVAKETSLVPEDAPRVKIKQQPPGFTGIFEVGWWPLPFRIQK